MVLRALFKPPQSTNVQKAVAPLLDAEEDVLRDKAAAVLGQVSLGDDFFFFFFTAVLWR